MISKIDDFLHELLYYIVNGKGECKVKINQLELYIQKLDAIENCIHRLIKVILYIPTDFAKYMPT